MWIACPWKKLAAQEPTHQRPRETLPQPNIAPFQVHLIPFEQSDGGIWRGRFQPSPHPRHTSCPKSGRFPFRSHHREIPKHSGVCSVLQSAGQSRQPVCDRRLPASCRRTPPSPPSSPWRTTPCTASDGGSWGRPSSEAAVALARSTWRRRCCPTLDALVSGSLWGRWWGGSFFVCFSLLQISLLFFCHFVAEIFFFAGN